MTRANAAPAKLARCSRRELSNSARLHQGLRNCLGPPACCHRLLAGLATWQDKPPPLQRRETLLGAGSWGGKRCANRDLSDKPGGPPPASAQVSGDQPSSGRPVLKVQRGPGLDGPVPGRLDDQQWAGLISAIPRWCQASVVRRPQKPAASVFASLISAGGKHAGPFRQAFLKTPAPGIPGIWELSSRGPVPSDIYPDQRSPIGPALGRQSIQAGRGGKGAAITCSNLVRFGLHGPIPTRNLAVTADEPDLLTHSGYGSSPHAGGQADGRMGRAGSGRDASPLCERSGRVSPPGIGDPGPARRAG